MAVGSAVLVAGWLGVATSAALGNGDDALAAREAQLAKMQAELADVKSQTAALKGDVAARAEMLEARHKFLAALIGNKASGARLAAMLPRATTGANVAVSDLIAPAAGRMASRGKASGALAPATVASVTEPFRQLESQQLAFASQAATAAQARLRDTQALIRRLGLDPSRFTASSDLPSGGVAMGGPYIPVADADPRFRELFVTWRQLETLQNAVAAIPAYMPVKDFRFTSGFGFRYDPFNGGSALHAGLDMAGAQGEPIYAAASGTVAKAGVANGYGNLVELSHGKGIETRYGHLSRILVRPGDFVRQGQVIGRMGSTGRSTGTHLHYEVRVDGRAVNPRPFLEASSFVLAAQQSQQGPVLDDDDSVTSDTPLVTAMATGTAGAPMTPVRYR